MAPAGQAGAALTVRWTALGPIGLQATVVGHTEVPLQAASAGGLDAALLRDKLAALGGTPFRLGAIDLANLEPGLHVPVSALKALRLERAAVQVVVPEPQLSTRLAAPTTSPIALE